MRYGINIQVKVLDEDGNASPACMVGVPVEADNEGQAMQRFQQGLAALFTKPEPVKESKAK